MWGELVTHCPSYQGWAPECPLHHMCVFVHCGCGLVGSGFPSFLCNYLSSVRVVCYIHVFSCIYTCGGYEQCVRIVYTRTCVLGMSIVYMYTCMSGMMYMYMFIHVCRVAHRVYMCTHIHVHDADTQHTFTCTCMCRHTMLLPNTHEYTMLLPKPSIHDP